MLYDYFRISFRNISRRKLRSWLTLVGIVIGITAVVALIGLGQGLEKAITSQFSALDPDMISVSATGGFGPPGFGVSKPLTKDNLEDIRKVNGVDKAGARLLEAGKLEFNDVIGFGYAGSMPKDEGRELIIEVLDLETQKGKLFGEDETGKVVIGADLADEDTAERFGKKIDVGSKILINDEVFEVIGILEKLNNFLLDSLVIMNEDDMRELFELSDDEYDIIMVRAEKKEDIPKVVEDIEQLLRKDRDVKLGEEDFSVETAQNILDTIDSVIFAVQLFVYIIAGLSIVVGGFGIMNTMLTSVLERTRDIGIMKSIGARNSNIFWLFLIESGLIGSVGGLIGATFGALAAFGVTQVLGSELIQADISFTLFGGAVLGSFTLGSIFGVVPAYRASRLHPVDALRHKK